jgi:hypothetical protein
MKSSKLLAATFVALGGLTGCGSDGSSDGGPTTCGASTPIECRTPEGALVGCCTTAHPVCATDGKSCFDFGSGGSGASGGSGGTGASGAGGTGGSGGAAGSGGSGASGGTGAHAGTGGTGGSGGTGATCADTDEPNDDESTAKNLGAIDDCDGSGATITDVLDGANDVDWLTFYGNDTFGCVVDPFAATNAQVRLCLFADCPSAQVTCSSGTPATSPLGRPGCCVAEGGADSLSLNCNGVTDSSSLYVRVDQPKQDVCQTYSLTYHY